MVDSIPLKDLPSILTSSHLPQYDADTVALFLQRDAMFRDLPVYLHDGKPVMSPCMLRGKPSYSWYWDGLVVTPYVPFAYSELPGLWASFSDHILSLPGYEAMLSGGVLAQGQCNLSDYAWMAKEHVMVASADLSNMPAKRRNQMKKLMRDHLDQIEVCVIPAHQVAVMATSLLGYQTIHWKARCTSPDRFEYSLRQWVWALCVCETGKGKLIHITSKVTGDALATLAFFDHRDYWVYGAISMYPASSKQGLGSLMVYLAGQMLGDSKPVHLSTSSDELDDSLVAGYKINCATGSIQLPCFASISNTSQTVQPPFYDSRNRQWVAD